MFSEDSKLRREAKGKCTAAIPADRIPRLTVLMGLAAFLILRMAFAFHVRHTLKRVPSSLGVAINPEISSRVLVSAGYAMTRSHPHLPRLPSLARSST